MRPGVEAQDGPLQREQLGEPARRLGLLRSGPTEDAVTAAGRGLADSDLGQPVAQLDALVGGAVHGRVDPRRGRLAADVLRREELAEVRLVPDRVVADEGIAAIPTRVARSESPREVAEVGRPRGRVVLAFAAVRP